MSLVSNITPNATRNETIEKKKKNCESTLETNGRIVQTIKPMEEVLIFGLISVSDFVPFLVWFIFCVVSDYNNGCDYGLPMFYA